MQIFIITGLISVMLSFACGVTYGQTFSEWWQQKKTRLKYLRQQEAALAALRETIENGYNQAAEGLDSIGTITNQELDLHELFLKNMRSVKWTFKNCSEVITSRGLALALLTRLLNTIQSLPDIPEFEKNAAWLKVYGSALTRVIMADMKELDTLTADDAYAMKDADRYDKIRSTANHLRCVYESSTSFLLEVEEWLMIRQANANEEFVRKHL